MMILTTKTKVAFLFTLLATGFIASNASAQSAGSWVDVGRGRVGAGSNAKGLLQFGKSRSSSKNGVDFGHGFAVGAGPNGIALSNSVGVGGGPLGAAHNVQLNIGRGGAHISHGGVVTQGGNRRVISGGQTGTTSNGRVFGGSSSTGFGNRTNTYSKSRTVNFQKPSGQNFYNRNIRRFRR
ncbi:hypothetical protein [Stieleria sp. JC731]|nr:hypothetical protein [Stieleria sp. JC731]